METVAFDVERFERVDASAGTVLLRLSGTFAPDVEPGAPELLVDDGRDARHVQPLPDPSGGPAPGGDARADFPRPPLAPRPPRPRRAAQRQPRRLRPLRPRRRRHRPAPSAARPAQASGAP